MAKCVSQGWNRFLKHLSIQVRPSIIQHGSIVSSGPTLQSRSSSYGAPKLAPQEVTTILRANESSEEIKVGSVLSMDINQLPSNDPIEDSLSVAKCMLTTGMLFGVFDGHGGHLLGQITSQRLMDYIALSILPHKLLVQYASCESSDVNLVEFIHSYEGLSPEQTSHHKIALKAFAKRLLEERKKSSTFKMKEVVTTAFEQFDEDMSNEVQNGIQHHLEESLTLAVMGSCACVAHIDEEHLYVAASGDCKAVLGVLTEENVWTAKSLSREHNTDNVDEIKRVYSQHPKSEENLVIKNDRLLGLLAPLRAFGDYNFKWKESTLKELLVPFFGPAAIPPNYTTPPYLTAKPEVIRHQLSPKDKFLVIASDGLWEQIMPHKVVKMVGEFMSGKQVLDLLKPPQPNMQLGAINQILLQRREGLDKKPVDSNAATHLIRNSLGWTECGVEHSKLSSLLSLPKPIVRNFRDDMTVIVVFFDSEYLRQTPA